MNPLVVLRGPNGTTVDEECFVVYENNKPVNIWKSEPKSETGLKDNDETDLRTMVKDYADGAADLKNLKNKK
jgi:hypothetical protein